MINRLKFPPNYILEKSYQMSVQRSAVEKGRITKIGSIARLYCKIHTLKRAHHSILKTSATSEYFSVLIVNVEVV